MKTLQMNFSLITLLLSVMSYAQVGIGTTNPNATLDIQSSNQVTPANNDGVLIPKIDNFPSVNPTINQNGMLVFVTGNGVPYKGFYYWDNVATSWVIITGTSNSGGNTLNEAYDQGGLGLGKSIEATDGAVLINGEDGFLVTGSFGTGNTIDAEVTGSGTRMFFNPNKAAFRAGRVLGNSWNDINIGENSTAFGVNTVASGQNSTAFGFGTMASGDNSLAFGNNTIASGVSSTAFGLGTTASQNGSTAFGDYANASGNYATAFGAVTTASGDYSTAFGYFTTASGDYSTVFGDFNTASNIYSTAFGFFNEASGYSSTAFGQGNLASGSNTIAFGLNTAASGAVSIAFGTSSHAIGDFSFAIGGGAQSIGSNSYSIGQGTQSTGAGSMAFGAGTQSNGLFSMAFGLGTTTHSYGETTFGTYNTTYTPVNNTNLFIYSPTDRLFTIGNGLGPATSSNALTIYKSGLMNINDEYDMPLTDGTANQVMTTNGAGVVSFQDASSLSGNTLGQAYNEGGFGFGRIINANNGPVEIHDSGGFIVQSANQTHMLFVDGVNDAIGINTAVTTADLSVNGTANKSGGGTWAVFSDLRLKENVSNYKEGLELITKIRPVNFSYNTKMRKIFGNNQVIKNKIYQGVIAQELKIIAPDMVREISFESEKFLEVDPNKFTYALINAVQEQQDEIEQQSAKIKKLEDQLKKLQNEIEAIRVFLKKNS
ncbi:tail fiber domain-containing protein [Lacinutrix cladophorae]